MKHFLTGAIWIFIALGLPLKTASLLMFLLIFVTIWLWAAKLFEDKPYRSSVISNITQPGKWQP